MMPTLSLRRAPTAPVLLARSEPARSTKCNLACTYEPAWPSRGVSLLFTAYVENGMLIVEEEREDEEEKEGQCWWDGGVLTESSSVSIEMVNIA